MIPTREALERLVEWTGPARDTLGLAVEIPEVNGAQRMSRALADGARLADVFRAAVSETRRTYVPAAALG